MKVSLIPEFLLFTSLGVLFVAGCRTTITKPQPMTLDALAASMMEPTAESGRTLRATMTDASTPKFALQTWSAKEIVQLADAPQPAIAAIHHNGSVSIFGLEGWAETRKIADNGYEIWYHGDSMETTLYVDRFGHTIRVCRQKNRKNGSADALIEYVLARIPPADGPEVVVGPSVIEGPRMQKLPTGGYVVMGPMWGLPAIHPYVQAQTIAKR